MKPLHTLSALVGALPPDRGIVIHSAAAHPTVLGRRLAEEAGALRGRRLFTLMPLGPVAYADAPARDAFDIVTFLPGAALRPALDAGRVTASRQPLSEVAQAFSRGEYKAGAVLLRTSPPDASGRVCLGVAVDYMPAAIEHAQVVVAEIDPHMPRTCGGSWIDGRRIDAYVDAEDGPHTLPAAPADPTDQAIATHVASLVEDGATLQLGVGSLPDQVLARVGHLRHLGLHTGIIGEGAQALIERGVVDNSRKECFAGVSVATMALGSASFYSFLDRNTAVELQPCTLTHDAAALRMLSRLTCVNSALQVGLDGRVNAEWAGTRRVAVPGGLTDFARAASSLPLGKSIVALRSTDRTGASTIVPSLRADVPASLEPHEVDFFVTEHGVAAVRGCSADERRRALAAIAHPSHREQLARP